MQRRLPPGHDDDRDVEAELEGMHARVERLKGMVGAIGEEAKEHNRLLGDLEASFAQARAALAAGVQRMNRQLAKGVTGGNPVALLILFALLLFLGLYCLGRFARIARWLGML